MIICILNTERIAKYLYFTKRRLVNWLNGFTVELELLRRLLSIVGEPLLRVVQSRVLHGSNLTDKGEMTPRADPNPKVEFKVNSKPDRNPRRNFRRPRTHSGET